MADRTAELEKALRAVEWSWLRRAGPCDDITAPVIEYCPWCALSRSAGHSSDCLVGNALNGMAPGGREVADEAGTYTEGPKP